MCTIIRTCSEPSGAEGHAQEGAFILQREFPDLKVIVLESFQSFVAFTSFLFLQILNNVLDNDRLLSEFNLSLFPFAYKLEICHWNISCWYATWRLGKSFYLSSSSSSKLLSTSTSYQMLMIVGIRHQELSRKQPPSLPCPFLPASLFKKSLGCPALLPAVILYETQHFRKALVMLPHSSA